MKTISYNALKTLQIFTGFMLTKILADAFIFNKTTDFSGFWLGIGFFFFMFSTLWMYTGRVEKMELSNRWYSWTIIACGLGAPLCMMSINGLLSTAFTIKLLIPIGLCIACFAALMRNHRIEFSTNK